jgi:GT2 family glycosyltransferase
MTSQDNKFFSVVIPTYERADDLRTCLHSLRYENQKGSPPYEIIVTDDSSTDRSRKLVAEEFPSVSWGMGKRNGPAGNRNAGVDRANGDWVVFLDDDCIAQTGYLEGYAKAIRSNPESLAFEGRIFPERPRKTWAEGCPENERGGMFWTSNLCVKRKLYLDMDGLDERFEIAYEDVDFAYRLQAEGNKVIFIREASVCHPWRSLRQGGKNWKRKGYELESLTHFLQKHPECLSTHGSPRTYVRHFARMLTKDFLHCLLRLRGRGLDILFSQAVNSLRVAWHVRNIKGKL